jgi:hypothetical protein
MGSFGIERNIMYQTRPSVLGETKDLIERDKVTGRWVSWTLTCMRQPGTF